MEKFDVGKSNIEVLFIRVTMGQVDESFIRYPVINIECSRLNQRNDLHLRGFVK